MFRLTDDESRKPHQTNYRCQVGPRLQYAVGKASTLRRTNWFMTSAAENEAVCHDRRQHAARNRNQICKKHQEIADGAHGTRKRATVARFPHKKSFGQIEKLSESHSRCRAYVPGKEGDGWNSVQEALWRSGGRENLLEVGTPAFTQKGRLVGLFLVIGTTALEQCFRRGAQ